jgi:hypothetical protein
LTLDWSNIDFLSYLENPVALSHITELHTLLRNFSHTHAFHELSLLLEKFYLEGNFCAYWLLTLNYILVYFWMLFDCFISYLYIRVLKLKLGKKISAYFPLFFNFWCEASWRTCSCVRTCSALLISYLTACRPDEYVPCPDTSFLLFLPNTHTLLFVCSIMLCCVCFLSDWSRDFGIHCGSFLIPRYFLWLSLFS